MSREDFISDNLVDMREKLRRNYEAMNAQMQKGKAPAEAASDSVFEAAPEAETAPEPQTAAQETAPAVSAEPQKLPPPLPRSANPDELERSRRELEGAMHRDYARMLKERELLQEKQQEQERFFDALTEFLKELNHADDRKQLDLLRLRYLEAQGRAQAYLGDASSASQTAPEEPRTMGRIFAEGMPFLIGSILAALIIALVIAFVF